MNFHLSEQGTEPEKDFLCGAVVLQFFPFILLKHLQLFLKLLKFIIFVIQPPFQFLDQGILCIQFCLQPLQTFLGIAPLFLALGHQHL